MTVEGDRDANAESPLIATDDDSKPQPRMPLLGRIRRMRRVLILMFLVGFIASTPSSIIPSLQDDTFGGNAFVITGSFGAVKGAIGFILAPIFGSLSDIHGRRIALIVTQAVSVIPYVLFLVTGGNFWAYSVANTLFGIYDSTLTLLMACVTDVIPTSSGVQTESFAFATAVFFFGIATAPFLGAFLTADVTFIICGSLVIFSLLYTVFIFEETLTKVDENSEPDAGATTEHTGPAHPAVNTSVGFHAFVPSYTACKSAPGAGDQVDESGASVAVSTCPCGDSKVLTQRCPVKRLVEALKKMPDLRMVAWVIFFNALPEQMLDKLLLLYLKRQLNFTTTEQAIIIAILGVGSVIGLVVVTSVLRNRFGSFGTLRIELAANVVICTFYSFLRVHWGVMLVTGLSVIGMGVFPCACAMASLTVSSDASGIAQGVATASRMAAAGIAPLAFGVIFQETEHSVFPGVSFLIGAVFVAVALLLTTRLAPRYLTRNV